ncbi:MAG: T9SS type A sorting domain-containing protein, partial [Flavobacteriaceae bacterium]|nr:T9SS type A sorting domain-containing protein [Flavobacteriaceae bacterium]
DVFIEPNTIPEASGQGFPTFQTTLMNLTSSATIRVEGSPFSSSDVGEDSFELIIAPTVTEQAAPPGIEDGINYGGDNTKATLMLNAPNKDFVYVAASWNSYTPGASDLMKRDPSTGKYWLEITELTPLTKYNYQYWVYDQSPIADSPSLVKTADPFSTVVLSPFDDPFVPPTTYPDLPTYPAGQEREVTLLETGRAPYNWVVPDFTPPKKEDLIIYEVLIRDFDSDRNFQDLIDRIDYFKNLNITAIQLMPIMEFDGNESWGYNTAYHMALDKFYGTEDKFKEFIDLCHQNGIAVILDIALNHATGRNPLVRMWMDDPDNDGWGGPSTENPYFNQSATHTYSVFNDFDHSNLLTQNYTERVISHWINEFKIDGFRWDLTKGFTQNCSDSDVNCTESYQIDRVARLKAYADHSWLEDPEHYVIFEHLGTAAGSNLEGVEWADYRIGEGKGIMMWGKMNDNYNQLTMGYDSNSNFILMGHVARGYSDKRLIGYAESHDEERLMYKNLQFGNSSGGYDVTNLNTALSRMPALGAVTLTIPGPKMIWHFAELGMENSIFTCSDGSFNDPDCKLSTKPQPQWMNNWLSDPNRNQIYNAWSRINNLKINEPVFEGDYAIDSGTLTPRIYVFDNGIPANELRNVVILANFDVVAQNVTPDFPYTGTWYDLMDESGSSSINVSNTTTPINIPPGEFRMYGNALPETLSSDDFELNQDFKIYPNPTFDTFQINRDIDSIDIYDLTGKLIKTFEGGFSSTSVFDISGLSQSVYILKAKDNTGGQITAKIVKL